MSRVSKKEGNKKDPITQYMEGLKDLYGETKVEACRIALGIPKNELEPRPDDSFSNKYDQAFLSSPPVEERIRGSDGKLVNNIARAEVVEKIRKEYIPEDLSPRLKRKKKDLWENKRVLHVEAIEQTLQGHRAAPIPKLRDRQAKRYMSAYEQTTQKKKSSRTADAAAPASNQAPAPDMSEFEKEMEEKNKQVMAAFEREQVKKATSMVNALVTKEAAAQAAEDKAKASKARYEAFKKELRIAQMARKKASQEKTERCLNAAQAAFKATREEAYEAYNKLCKRLDTAQAYRDDKFDPGKLQKTQGDSAAKTRARIDAANAKRAAICDELQHRAEQADVRLKEQKEMIQNRIDQQIKESQQRFDKIQKEVNETRQKQFEERLNKHELFENHFNDVQKNRNNFFKTRSQTVKAAIQNSQSRAFSNLGNVNNEKIEAQERAKERMDYMDERCNYVKSLKLKCGQTIFAQKEVKEETFGELQKRNYRALKRSQDMAKSCTLLKVAETRAKSLAKEEQFKRAMAKKATIYRELAVKGELLNSTKDPKKLGTLMGEMGFPIPEILQPKKKE